MSSLPFVCFWHQLRLSAGWVVLAKVCRVAGMRSWCITQSALLSARQGFRVPTAQPNREDAKVTHQRLASSEPREEMVRVDGEVKTVQTIAGVN
jgi:hypothetical protein